MSDFITQEEFDKWCPDSLAPITHQVIFLKTPIHLIEEHYVGWLNQWANDVQDRMNVQFNRQNMTADLTWVGARREDLPNLLLPQNTIRDRHLFCTTDSPWTAVFTPNYLPFRTDPSMIESLQSYIKYRNHSDFDDSLSFVLLDAIPCVIDGSFPQEIPNSSNSPYGYFQSNGTCRIQLKSVNPWGNEETKKWIEIGHRAHPRPHGVEYSPINNGFRFSKPENYDELGIDSEDFISELPASFDDIEKEPIMGSEIWNIFGFHEMEMICADLGIRPFDKEFYSDHGLLATMWFENEPPFPAVPRVDLKHYQRMIGVGPDIIRSR